MSCTVIFSFLIVSASISLPFDQCQFLFDLFWLFADIAFLAQWRLDCKDICMLIHLTVTLVNFIKINFFYVKYRNILVANIVTVNENSVHFT